jgi:HAMP domain-containing protein
MTDEVKKTSIKTQFLFRFLFMGIFIVAVFVVLMMYTFRKNTDSRAMRTIQNIDGIYRNLVQNDIKMLSAALESFASNTPFKETFVSKDKAALQAMSEELFRGNRDRYGITHFYYIDEAGICFLRMHKPGFAGDLVTRTTYKEASEKNRLASGVELGKTAYALRVIMPYVFQGKTVGYIEFGEEIHHFDEVIHEKMGSDVVVLGDKKFLDKKKYAELKTQANQENNWDDLPDFVVLSNTFGEQEYFNANIFKAEEVRDLTGPVYLGTHEFGDRTLIKGAFPFYEAGNKRTGVVFVLTDITAQVNQYRASLLYIILVGIALFLFFLGLALRYLHVKVFRPVIALSNTADKISMGEELDKEIQSDRTDEIGVLTRSFDRMRISLNKLMKRLTDSRK